MLAQDKLCKKIFESISKKKQSQTETSMFLSVLTEPISPLSPI